MPKVETSSKINKKGYTLNDEPTNQSKFSVSKQIGIFYNNITNILENKYEILLQDKIPTRYKRDLDGLSLVKNASNPLLSLEQKLGNRRVVKKLIRVEPVSNVSVAQKRQGKELELPSNRKLRKKRVKIKKRRKPLKPIEENISESKTRRKVVITKKRLITKTTESNVKEMPKTKLATLEDNFATKTLKELILKPTDLLQSVEDSAEVISTESTTENKISLKNLLELEDYDDQTESSTEDSTQNENIDEESEVEEENATESEIPYSNLLESIELDEEESIESTRADENPNFITQNLPDYEPFFPELSESLDAPILLLKTTVISSVEYETKTVVQSRLRTYTFVITRVNGDEQIVTSTTEVKPQTKTLTVTEPITKFTTLTLLDFDATETLPFVPLTVFPSLESSTTPKNIEIQGESLF